MSEGSVCISHFVYIFTFLNGRTLAIVRIHKLSRYSILHAHAFSGTTGSDKPHGRQMILALATYFKWYLIVCAADAS
jgi:hypothetical protein